MFEIRLIKGLPRTAAQEQLYTYILGVYVTRYICKIEMLYSFTMKPCT